MFNLAEMNHQGKFRVHLHLNSVHMTCPLDGTIVFQSQRYGLVV